jgi:SAM-dependent methyltransferase
LDIKNLQKNWDAWAKKDAMWAILTERNKRGHLWNEDEFFKTGRQQIGAVIKEIEDAGLILQRTKALDFGCGVGRLTQALAEHFEVVNGVDIAPTMIEFAKQYNKYGERCAYFLNDQPDLKLFPDSSFDFIYTSIVLQHMRPDYAHTYIREFSRLLKPKGIVVFDLRATKPTPSSIMALMSLIIYRVTLGAYLTVKHLFEPTMEIYTTDVYDALCLLKSVNLEAVHIRKDSSVSRTEDGYIYTCRLIEN